MVETGIWRFWLFACAVNLAYDIIVAGKKGSIFLRFSKVNGYPLLFACTEYPFENLTSCREMFMYLFCK